MCTLTLTNNTYTSTLYEKGNHFRCASIFITIKLQKAHVFKLNKNIENIRFGKSGPLPVTKFDTISGS